MAWLKWVGGFKMRSYKGLVLKNLKTQWRRCLLTSIAIALAVSATVSIFSLLDTLIQFRINQAVYENGKFQFKILGCNEDEINEISKESSIEQIGTVVELNTAKTESDQAIELSAFNLEGAKMMGITMKEGVFPEERGTIAIEEWFLHKYMNNASIGDAININYDGQDGKEHSYSFKISGVLKNNRVNEAKGVPNMIVSLDDASIITENKTKDLIIWVSSNSSISKIEKNIITKFSINNERIVSNKIVLILTDSQNPIMQKVLYPSGLLIVAIIMLAAVIMIYNAINISVMDRIRQFGLLKCIGATNGQIFGLILRESIIIALISILPGIIIGIVATLTLVLFIKSIVSNTIGEFIPFMISSKAIIVGIIIGMVTIISAAFKPAQRAAKASPVHVASGSAFTKLKQSKVNGILSKKIPVEIVLAIRNVVLSKSAFIITSLSLATGLFMFLTFNVLVDFLDISNAATRPSYCDFTLISQNLYTNSKDTDFTLKEIQNLSKLPQIKDIYLKKYTKFSAKLPMGRITSDYTEFCKSRSLNLFEENDGLITLPDTGEILSFDDKWLKKGSKFLISGSIDGVVNGSTQGVLFVGGNYFYGSKMIETVKPKVGDKIYINTGSGYKSVTVEGILTALPDATKEGDTLMCIVVNHKTFDVLTESKTYQQVDIKVKSGFNVNEVERILSEVISKDNSRKSFNWRIQNLEANQIQMVMKIFIYGFIYIIILIGFLNILNTMIMRIITKTREIGLLKATGMTNNQTLVMIIFEAFIYGALACLLGTIVGILMSRLLYFKLITSVFGIQWHMDLHSIIGGIIITFGITVISVIYPVRAANKVSAIVASMDNR